MNYFQAKPIKRLLAHKFFSLWIAEIWTIIIAFLCLVQFGNLPRVGVKGADKYVHFTFYFVFTILWFLYFKNKNGTVKSNLLKVFFLALLYGVLIELAQSFFTLTRKADIWDVLANATGAFFAIVAILFYNTFLKKDILKSHKT